MGEMMRHSDNYNIVARRPQVIALTNLKKQTYPPDACDPCQ